MRCVINDVHEPFYDTSSIFTAVKTIQHLPLAKRKQTRYVRNDSAVELLVYDNLSGVAMSRAESRHEVLACAGLVEYMRMTFPAAFVAMNNILSLEILSATALDIVLAEIIPVLYLDDFHRIRDNVLVRHLKLMRLLVSHPELFFPENSPLWKL